ncbi:MAG: hypothetical protein AB1631_02135, partial [Acidobacteriota bacterium]
MSSAIDDLWPADIARVTDKLPPITILKQQASLLGQRTKNIVEAEVETTSNDKGGLRHTLYLVAPALDFYRHPLLEVEHEVTRMYPAMIKVTGLNIPKKAYRAINEAFFMKILRSIFAHQETKEVIGNLLVQSGVKVSPAIKTR